MIEPLEGALCGRRSNVQKSAQERPIAAVLQCFSCILRS